MRTIREFIEEVQGKSDHTVYRTYAKKYPLSTKEVMKTIEYEEIEKENQHQCIYFIPSIGGTKIKQIHTMTACYGDFDCGRPKKGEYYPEEVVAEYKLTFIEKLEKLPLKPSVIVETRNGFHVYWNLCEPVHNQHQWREVQGKIATYLKGDYAVCSPHQPMRLPFTWWRKKKEGLRPFYVRVIQNNGIRYSFQELQRALADVMIPTDRTTQTRVFGRAYYDSTCQGGPTDDPGPRSHFVLDGDNRNIEAILNNDVEYLRDVLKPAPRKFTTYQDCLDYLTKEVSLEGLIGVHGRSCHCPFHDDGTPSAGFFRAESTGENLFNCFGCGTRGNIRGLVQHIRGGSYHQAMMFLKEVYQLSIEQSEWQQERRCELEEIKRVIDNDLEHYPHLHKNVRDDLMLLRIMVDIAMDNIYDEQYTDSQGRMIFWTSFRHLARRYGIRHHKTINTKVVSLALHKLLDRIHHDDVPEFLRRKSKAFQIKRDGKNGKLVSYYAIPSLSVDSLVEADDIARTVQQSGLSRCGYSYEGIARTFSPELADTIYVQRSFSGLSKMAIERSDLMHEITMDMIESRGWATEVEIQEQMEAQHKRTVSRLTIKRALPELCQSYGLVSVWWTRELRERFGIKEKVMGKIIIKA